MFLENYDMALGRAAHARRDVWLNTPRRPLEASGTSGMKAAMNGVLNLSVLDGWWPEGCRARRRPAGPSATAARARTRITATSRALYATLEDEVLPAFADPRAGRG